MVKRQEYSYTIVLQPEEEGGFSVSVPALPGCHTEGDTREEALANAKDAIELYLAYLIEANKPIPPDIEGPIVETIQVVA